MKRTTIVQIPVRSLTVAELFGVLAEFGPDASVSIKTVPPDRPFDAQVEIIVIRETKED